MILIDADTTGVKPAPAPEPKPKGLDTGDGHTTKDYSTWVKRVSADAIAAGREKARSAAFNWLMLNGMPKEPHEVWAVIDSVWFSAITWAGVNGYVELTEKGTRQEGEAPAVTDGDDPFYTEELGLSELLSEATGPTGGYL